ncbi:MULTISPECIES: CapA family protein [Rhizobium]|uniref:CapA family protein n=1 Tax=Rhizobium TaxID=379 RepID=UPI001618189F|nr:MULTISPECIES: CapA family protein [Rhizobium]MBB6305576.1 poly-gamma-glutamate synthesis protein (capsule biosynthesis protein) [Rhizobium leucaenae]MDK4743630.1 CapA family protein [Rhizobium sp. CNPSo 3464]
MTNHCEEKDTCQKRSSATYDTVGSTATNVSDGFTMVAVGDLIVSRPLTRGADVGFGDIVKILRDADVTFGNLEMNIFDIRSFNGSPQAEYGGAYHVSVPELGPDLKVMGFNILSRANNHALDWGLEGMRETSRILDECGIIHAGGGESHSQASAARFLETGRGRVAMISFASTYLPLSRAADSAGEAPARPGLNALRLTESIVVPREMLESLKQIRRALPGPKPDIEDEDQVRLGGKNYKLGERVSLSYEVNPKDLASILQNVRRGKQFADFCIVTNHGHEPENWSQEPPDYERSFAHKMIDAGADAYIVHGPHQLRGIEIYKGRPIFYSVGNFIMDDLRTPVGADMFDTYNKDPRTDTDAEVTVSEMAADFSDPVYYESVITVSRFKHNQLSAIQLFPIDLGPSLRLANRGVPRLAAPPLARAILERLQRLSREFGTEIAIEDNIGVIRLAASNAPTQ